MRNKTLIVVCMMVLHCIAYSAIHSATDYPTDDAQSTSARAAAPDINVTLIEWIGPSYYHDSSAIDIIAPGVQEVRITVENEGLLSGIGALTVFIDSGDGAGPNSIGSQSIALAPAGVAQYIFSFTATTGTNQEIKTHAAMLDDADPNNNNLDQDFEVSQDNIGEVYSDTLPAHNTRLAQTNTVVSIGVRNAGNSDHSATPEITLTPLDGGAPVTISGDPVTLDSGSIAYPPPVELASLIINATSLAGDYTLSGQVYFNSTVSGTSDVVQIISRTVSFSEYRTTLIAPSDRAVEPGASSTLTFLIQNIGEAADRYNITVGSSEGWADLSGIPAQTPIVNASSSTVIVVPVTVPLGVDRSSSDLISVHIESEGGEYTISDTTSVMAGDLLIGQLNHSSWLVPIIPGTEEIIQYTLYNNGTSPSIFNLDAGFSQTAPGWVVEIEPSITPYMTVGEELIVTVIVQPPSLSLPFDPLTKLAEGNQLTLWTSVTPVDGGPNVQQTTLEVQSTIMVELMTDQTEFPISITELMSGPVSRFIDMDMELRHNLISGISTTVDIQVATNVSEFTSTAPPNGLNEILRWNSSVTPSQTSMELGESQPLVTTILGPSDYHPLAGTLTINVIANLTLSGALSGIQAPETNISLTFEIPEYSQAEIQIPPPTTVTPEILSTVPIILANTGNHQTNFSLSVSGPDGWITSVSPSSAPNLHSIIDAWPSVGGDNLTLTLSVTAPQNTRADTPFTVNITVFSDSGEILTVAPIPFVVQEVIGGSLSVDYAVAVIPVNGNSSIALEANNTGNSLQSFTISIEESLEDINLTMISSTEIEIEPGQFSIVQVEVTADQFARADENHSAQIVLSHNGIELDRVDVYIEMIANHQIEFDHASEYSVVPGKSLSIPVNVTNFGNLEEFMNFTTIPPLGWQASVTPLNMTIDGEGLEILPLTIHITVPPMSNNAGLEPGSIHNLALIANNVSDSINIGSTSVQFNVEPDFNLSSDDFPDVANLIPGEVRTFDIKISNDGNQDVVLDLDCEVDNPSRWEISACETTNLTLESGATRSLTFSVRGIAINHYNNESSLLVLRFTPQDNHSSVQVLDTELRISRMHSDEPVDLAGSNSPEPIPINWMHVQSEGQTADSSPASYQLTLVEQTRIINSSLYPGDIDWSFEIDYGIGFVPLSNESTFTLNPTSPLALQTMRIRPTLPDPPIPPGDGWDFTFELTHPGDFSTTLTTLELRVGLWADPSVSSIYIDDQSDLKESESRTLIAEIHNGGNTRTAPGIEATLECEEGISIQTSAKQGIDSLASGETKELQWQIQTNALHWWTSSNEIPCTVSIDSPVMEGDIEDNDVGSESLEVQSWSIPLLVLIPITITLVIVSSRLLRRAPEDERSLMLSAYSGTVLLGLATQYNLGPYVNFTLASVALIWVGFIASRSSAFEIPAILSDRQNLQRGAESIIEDHEEEMNRVLKQLTTKLCFAPLGFIIVAIFIPGDISWSLLNIGSVVLYAIAGILTVISITSRTRNSWLAIFDELASMEIESQELLVQLGNPSADLRRITIGQRWGAAHDVSVEVDDNV